MIRHEVVAPSDAIQHSERRLGKLDIVLHAKGSESWRVDADQRAKVKGNLHPDKLDVGSTTVGKIAINNWQQNCRVGGRHLVVYLVPRVVMEAQYRETAEITPAVVEEAKPIVSNAVDRGG
jgi:hypothetical protein